MSGSLDPTGGGSGAGGGGGGLFGGLGGKGGAGGPGGAPMDQKALRELVPALAQLQSLVESGAIDDSMLKELKGQLTSQGASLQQLVQVRQVPGWEGGFEAGPSPHPRALLHP